MDKYPHAVLSFPHEWEPSKVKFLHHKKQFLEDVITDIHQDVAVSLLSSRIDFIPMVTEDQEPWGSLEHMS